jgi:broad specificity phosphatase PhoE
MGPPGSLLLVRHGRSTYNVARRLNGDPAVPVDLDRTGIAQMAALRERIDPLPVDLAVHTRFGRTRRSLDILLEGREVPRVECADLDDVRLGRFEGAEVGAYRAWREGRGQEARPEDGGESRIDALARYARGFERLAAARAELPLVVTHDIPIRFLANAMRGEDPLDGPVTAVANGSLLVVPRPRLLAAIGVMKMTLTGAAP